MNSTIKKHNKNIGVLKLALVVVLILILGLVFLYTWTTYYNPMLRFRYVLKGNIFMMLIYMTLLYIFMIVFDCNNLSTHKTGMLILSELLSTIACNIIVYLVVIIPAAAIGLLPFMPIIQQTIIDFIAIVIWALFVSYILNKISPPKNILLISNDSEMDEIISKISKRRDLYKIGDKIVFNRNDINNIYSECDKYEDVLIGDLSSEDRNDIIKHCFNNSINVYVIPKLSDILIKYSDDLFVFDAPIYYSSNFGLSLESSFFKRFIDIFFSLIILFVFLPLWIIIAILIKLEDGGPIFYFQERVTIDFKRFNIIKFRSMKQCNDELVIPTVDNDDRITKIGNFIRKYHIDEVPQFINVLIGDMSVVGPRPERIEHVNLYIKEIPEFAYRFKVKAGITGLAQIYGKYNTSAINKLKLDLVYIKRYSFMFDLELIFRTIKVLFIKDNTEGFELSKQEYITENAKNI